METATPNTWRKCSSCKKSIDVGTKYYVCSVSTCNAQRTNYVFCTVHCFERHLPGARHKDAAAVEMKAPMQPAPQATPAPAPAEPAKAEARPAGQRVYAAPPATAPKASSNIPRETLIIASRLKDYIQARGDYNTSASVMDVLSDHVRVLCDRAMDQARADGRKTVMDRDFDFLKSR